MFPEPGTDVYKRQLFTFDNEWSMSGKDLTDGQHRITIRRKKGNGNIYAGSTLSYFCLLYTSRCV